jgi:hypothetical protein
MIKMSSDNPASEVYAKRLLLEEVGYPFWYPDPPLDQNVPRAYRDHDASTDHVDKITGGEASKYKFNVCTDTGDAIDVRDVSANFERWIIGRQDPTNFHAMRSLKRGDMAREWLSLRTIISSNFTASTDLLSDRSLDVNIESTSLSPNSAILILPGEASKEDPTNT